MGRAEGAGGASCVHPTTSLQPDDSCAVPRVGPAAATHEPSSHIPPPTELDTAAFVSDRSTTLQGPFEYEAAGTATRESGLATTHEPSQHHDVESIRQGCQLDGVLAAAWPRARGMIVTPDTFVWFFCPAKIWQKVPVVARHIDAPNIMLVSIHPRRLYTDPCETPDMVSYKWTIWIDETDARIKPVVATTRRVQRSGYPAPRPLQSWRLLRQTRRPA